MLFNSYEFVFAFFPLALAGVCFCRRMERRTGKRNLTEAFALVVSLLFYAFRSPEYLPVLLVSMAVNYGLFCLMEREAAKTGARKERFADRRHSSVHHIGRREDVRPRRGQAHRHLCQKRQRLII